MNTAQIVVIIVLVGSITFQLTLVLGQALAQYLMEKLPQAQRAKVSQLATVVVQPVEADSAGLTGSGQEGEGGGYPELLCQGLGPKVPQPVLKALVNAAVLWSPSGSAGGWGHTPSVLP